MEEHASELWEVVAHSAVRLANIWVRSAKGFRVIRNRRVVHVALPGAATTTLERTA